jgi:hypothetical protein
MLRFALIASLVAVGPLTADADCASYGLAPKVLTPDGTTIPSTGGIVVAAVPLPQGRLEKGDPAVQPTWRYKGQVDKPTIVSLAPGLALMSVGRPTELVDGKGVSLIKVNGTKGSSTLDAAPKVTAIRHVVNGMPSYHGSVHVVVDLAVPPPPDTVAVIVGDAKGPRSWGLIKDPKSTSVEPYVQQYCEVLPNGTVASNPGDAVWVKFVDSAGRVSPASASIKIAAQSKSTRSP